MFDNNVCNVKEFIEVMKILCIWCDWHALTFFQTTPSGIASTQQLHAAMGVSMVTVDQSEDITASSELAEDQSEGISMTSDLTAHESGPRMEMQQNVAPSNNSIDTGDKEHDLEAELDELFQQHPAAFGNLDSMQLGGTDSGQADVMQMNIW